MLTQRTIHPKESTTEIIPKGERREDHAITANSRNPITVLLQHAREYSVRGKGRIQQRACNSKKRMNRSKKKGEISPVSASVSEQENVYLRTRALPSQGFRFRAASCTLDPSAFQLGLPPPRPPPTPTPTPTPTPKPLPQAWEEKGNEREEPRPPLHRPRNPWDYNQQTRYREHRPDGCRGRIGGVTSRAARGSVSTGLGARR